MILNKEVLKSMHKETFMNLISNFSTDSPWGRIEMLLATDNKNLTGEQRIIKNRIIVKRSGVDTNWNKK